MTTQLSPATLGILLSRLETFSAVKHKLEQYATPSQLAATFLYTARNDLSGKRVLDLGAGTGILGLGAALLGAHVICVEKDADAMAILRKNLDSLTPLSSGSVTEVLADIDEFAPVRVDTVIMNPPFGTKDDGADKRFLRKAFACAPVVWSMHKTTTITHLERFAQDVGFTLTARNAVDFAIPKTHPLHRKKRVDVAVTIVCFRKAH